MSSSLDATGVASCSLSESTGTYQVTASYAGDVNYSTATAVDNEVVNETSTDLALSTSSLVYGLEQSATFSVTVTPPPGLAPPTGVSVQLMANTKTLCVTTPLAPSSITVMDPVLGPVSVPVATATCHLTPAAVPAGTYSISAEFAGQPGLFVGSTSTPASLTVQSAPTSTAVSISTNSTTFGHRELRGRNDEGERAVGGIDFVTGSVTVRNAARILCDATLQQGLATCRLTSQQLPVGHHNIVADFAGDSSLVNSSSLPTTLNVEKAPTTSTLSLSHGSVRFGAEASVKITVRVSSPSGLPTASGRVVISSGSVRLSAFTLARAKGSCSLAGTKLSVGRHSIVASYLGSTTLQASVSRSQTLQVTRATNSHK